MYYYKFKVLFDEVEDFERIIEILSSDNFESFHKILYESIELTGHELASFSICDAKWNKKQEITLIDMQDDFKLETPVYDEEEAFSISSNIPKYIMKNAILKDFIIEPHQHIMYEYDFIHPKVFYIELLKTLPAKENAVFPRCTFSEGVLLKSNDPFVHSNSEENFINEFTEEIDEDDFDEDSIIDQIWDDSQSELDSF